MRLTYKFITLLATFLLSAQVFGVGTCSIFTDQVPSDMLGGPSGPFAGYGERIDFKHYQNSNKILLLGDKFQKVDFGSFSIGEKLAEEFPEKEIVSTDKGYDAFSQQGSFAQLPMDHTKQFFFQDNYFDTIVMRKGLCMCNPNTKNMCAGFCPTSFEFRDFLMEVTRVLNKEDPNAIAILHGVGLFRPTKEILERWKTFLEQIEAKYPVKTYFYYNYGLTNPENLSSILIMPKISKRG